MTFSDRVHAFEVRDLRTRVASVLMPAGLLVAIGVLVTPSGYVVGQASDRSAGGLGYSHDFVMHGDEHRDALTCAACARP